MMFGYGRTAQAGPDACPAAVFNALCQGNQSDGIASGVDFNPAVVTVLNVNNLTQDIAPAAGTDGIDFTSANAIVINSDTTDGPGGPFQIITTGAGAIGIHATSNLDVDITHSGDIVASDAAIYSLSGESASITSNGNLTSTSSFGAGALAINGTATVISTGNIDAGSAGIFASADLNVIVGSSGDISSATGNGILANSLLNDVNVESAGDIGAALNGIRGFGDGAITISSDGNIVSTTADGIDADSALAGVEITSVGNITAEQRGIDAEADAGVRVTSTGNITTNQDEGIDAYSATSTIRIVSDGNINAAGSGISAEGNLAVVVQSDGNISSAGSYGIFVRSVTGAVGVTSTGNINTDDDGIRVRGELNTRVTSVGDVTSVNGGGLFSLSFSGASELQSTGDVVAADSGVVANGDLDVSVTSHGNVTAGIYGLYAKSFSNNVSVTSSGGSVYGGNYGIYARSYAGTATIENKADSIITGGNRAIFSLAVLGTTVNNAGTVTGNVRLANGGGNNVFNNQQGSLFNSGNEIDLTGGLLRNAGTLAPGGEGVVQAAEVTGNVTQTATGNFQVDVDAASGTADRVNVTQTANLDGRVQVNVLNPVLGAQEHIILSAAGGATDDGIVLGPTSPALNATLSFPNATDVVLNTQVDFSIDGLNQNQTNLAENLNGVVGAGGGTMGPVLNALLGNVFTFADYTNALDQLLPEVYLNTETVALFAAEEFNGNLLSCPKAGEGFTAISQGQCMWVRYDGRWLDRSGTFENIGFDEDSHGISGGGQVAVAPNWYIGVAGAYEDGSLDTRTNASADTERYMLGGVIKYQSGPVLMALAGSIGTGDVDTARPISFGGFNATARSSYDVDHVGATFHAAYLMDRGAWYAKPFIDVNVTHIERDAARETGGGAANLNVSGSDETYVSATPALELGTTIVRGDGRAIRPYVRVGVTVYSDADQSLTARFAGAPAAAGSFTTRSEFDDVFGDIEAGVTLLHADHGTVSAGYEGRFSGDTEVHGIFVKGTRNF